MTSHEGPSRLTVSRLQAEPLRDEDVGGGVGEAAGGAHLVPVPAVHPAHHSHPAPAAGLQSPGQVELRVPGAGQLQVPVLPPGEAVHLLAGVPLLGPGAAPRLVSKLVPAVSIRAVNEPLQSFTMPREGPYFYFYLLKAAKYATATTPQLRIY